MLAITRFNSKIDTDINDDGNRESGIIQDEELQQNYKL